VEIWNDMLTKLDEAAPSGTTFSVPVTVAANTTTQLRGRCRSAAGLQSGFSAPFPYTHDDILPGNPTLTGTTPASPSNDQTPDFYGTTPSADCAVIEVWRNDTNVYVGEGPANPGTLSYVVNITVPANTNLPYATRCRDLAGNLGNKSVQLNYRHDGVAPTKPTISGTTPTSPSANPMPTANGQRGATNTDCTFIEIWKDTSVKLAEAPTGGVSPYAIPTPVDLNTTTVLRAQCRDDAGNVSGTSTTSVSYVHDDVAPSPPTLDGTTPAPPSNDYTPDAWGTATDPNCFKVEVWVNGFQVTEVSPAGGTWLAPSVFVTQNATNLIKARCRDSGGSTSDFTPELTYLHDNFAPSPAPVVAGSLPVSPSSDAMPEVYGFGTVADCAYIDVHIGSGPALVDFATRQPDGSWSVFVPVTLNTTNAISARCRDLAGNLSGWGAGINYVHDDINPPTPSTLTTTPASPSNNATPTVNGNVATLGCGTAEIWNQAGTTKLAEGAVCPTCTTFAVVTPVSANTSTYLKARCRDGAGNFSPYSGAIEYLHDNINPDVPTIDGTTPASPSKLTSMTVSGSSPASDCPNVEVWKDDGLGDVNLGLVSASGSWSKSTVVQVDRTSNFRARCKDTAGNYSTYTPNFPYVNDITSPSPSPSQPTFTPVSGAALPTADGTQPADCVWTQIWRDTGTFLHGEGSSSGGTYSITFTSAALSGAATYTARCRDAAGNYSGYSIGRSYTGP
jgi:hypothetical protein